MASKGLEALENISVAFDELGFVATTLNPYSHKHFIEWFGCEYDIIKKELGCFEEIKNTRTTPNVLETILAKYMNKCISLEQECENLQGDYEEKDLECIELYKENEKLKKALDNACKILSWDCPCSQDLIDDLDCENRCQPDIDYSECWKKYFLKEVLGNA